MENADNNEQTSASQTDTQAGGSNTEKVLSDIAEQIRAMNAQNQEAMKAVASSIASSKSSKKETVVEDDDYFDAKKLQKKVGAIANDIATNALKKERELNNTIYALTQDYPEIGSDPEIRKAVLQAHQSLPESIRDTADGYETAVLKAVSKAGLLPKNKRQARSDADDFAVGGQRGLGERRQETKGSKKVSNKTLAFAELLRGRSLTKEEEKGIEEVASNRDTFRRYR